VKAILCSFPAFERLLPRGLPTAIDGSGALDMDSNQGRNSYHRLHITAGQPFSRNALYHYSTQLRSPCETAFSRSERPVQADLRCAWKRRTVDLSKARVSSIVISDYTVEQTVVQRIDSFGTKAQLESLRERKSLFEANCRTVCCAAGERHQPERLRKYLEQEPRSHLHSTSYDHPLRSEPFQQGSAVVYCQYTRILVHP
jgi:hypothetical protein